MLTARLAQTGDLPLVQSITEQAYAEYTAVLGGLPLPVTEDYLPRIGAEQVWLISRDDADVGLLVLETDADALTIFSVAVLPEARGGVGRWMLAFAEARARAAGASELRLYTNSRMARNIAIYQQAGFTEVGRRPNEWRPGWFFVDMVKRLASGETTLAPATEPMP